MSGSNLRVAYLMYDGLEEPLGQSQVLPYLRGLADAGHRIELVSFEKSPHRGHFRAPLYPGIRWTALRYHREPLLPAKVLDTVQGASVFGVLAALQETDLVHVRSYAPALFAFPFIRLTRRPLLFDMRGLWPEEGVEDGTWSSHGYVFRGAKKVERFLLTRATAISVLTNAVHTYLRREVPFARDVHAPITVIPTCTDLDRFHPQVSPDPVLWEQLKDTTTLVYLGSQNGRYLPREMARFYLDFRRHVPRPKFLILSRQQPTEISSVLVAAGVREELVHRAVSHEQVPGFLRCAKAAVSFHPVSLARRGAMPTKIGEMLGCGLPVAGTVVGDILELFSEEKVGVVVPDMEPKTMDRAAKVLAQQALAPEISQRAFTAARRWFCLRQAIRSYDKLYRRLVSGKDGRDYTWPLNSHFD